MVGFFLSENFPLKVITLQKTLTNFLKDDLVMTHFLLNIVF